VHGNFSGSYSAQRGRLTIT